MSDFPEKLYSVDPPNQSSDGLYMIVHTKKTDKYTVEYTRTPPTPPDEDGEKLIEKLIWGWTNLNINDTKTVEAFNEVKSRLLSRLSQHEELVKAAREVQNILQRIRGGRKGSIGSIDNTYLPQLNRENLDKAADALDKALEGKEG